MDGMDERKSPHPALSQGERDCSALRPTSVGSTQDSALGTGHRGREARPGEWQVRHFESGTVVVTLPDSPGPWLDVHGPRSTHDACADRFVIAQELADYLNGGTRPAWLGDLHRESETLLDDVDGTCIVACGPAVDSDPPRLKWVEDETVEAQMARARLIDRLHLGRRQEARVKRSEQERTERTEKDS